MNGAQLIAHERQRQIQEEGWTYEHDQEHTSAELTRAAICYADRAAVQIVDNVRESGTVRPAWPWDLRWWKSKQTPLDNLVKAGALIAAEIDRLQQRKTEDQRPHSRACGWQQHAHGSACSTNCPTCHGLELP